MALPKEVVDGMECMRRESDSWHAVNDHLLSQDAEIARLQSSLATHVNSVCDLQSSLAAADELLRKIKNYGYWPSFRDEVAAHLSENTHVQP